jgi:hypothetical protein
LPNSFHGIIGIAAAIMKAPGATLPRLTSKKKLSKSMAEEHSHAKGSPTGSILFHHFFETDLSVVTTPNFFHKMLRTFTTEADPYGHLEAGK